MTVLTNELNNFTTFFIPLIILWKSFRSNFSVRGLVMTEDIIVRDNGHKIISYKRKKSRNSWYS